MEQQRKRQEKRVKKGPPTAAAAPEQQGQQFAAKTHKGKEPVWDVDALFQNYGADEAASNEAGGEPGGASRGKKGKTPIWDVDALFANADADENSGQQKPGAVMTKKQGSNGTAAEQTHNQNKTEKKPKQKGPKPKASVWNVDELFEKHEEEMATEKSQELYNTHIALSADEAQQLERHLAEARPCDALYKDMPPFLRCPLCRDLLNDPVVLPCFHTICRGKCVPRVTKDDTNLWCPQCAELKQILGLIENLKPAVTFEKMIQQHKEKMKEQLRKMKLEQQVKPEVKVKQEPVDDAEGAAATGTDTAPGTGDQTSTAPEQQIPGLGEPLIGPILQVKQENESETAAAADDSDSLEHDEAADLTCKDCQKIFGLPLRLSCGHSICKFPCAYRNFRFNSKILCQECEKPTWVKGVSELSVAKDLVARIQRIKGDEY